ncbi:cytochrome b-c1 complex subunit 8-like [Mus caroli]|uniref:Cytochrome b-c1 complex subunit 8 n=1 Tax=Mus caroli TaxID=10089 RepID=A0A6P7RJ07_MUSCR|nr:cytochrome b-c1 complex subunit 8-like [Mus caroli]
MDSLLLKTCLKASHECWSAQHLRREQLRASSALWRAAVTMGLKFGNLAGIRHVISYSLSPFEQHTFPSYFSKGIPNVLRRTRERILRVAPPFVVVYLIYTWGNQDFEQSKRKNPAMYENDK